MDPAVWNGATQGEWGLEVGTDGSGFDSDVPEMMQRGWAVVQLDQQGWPHTSEAREFAKGDPDSGQGRAACSIAGDKNDPHLEHHRRPSRNARGGPHRPLQLLRREGRIVLKPNFEQLSLNPNCKS